MGNYPKSTFYALSVKVKIMEIYNVLDFGILGDGKALNSESLQNAVDFCAMKGGGKLIFPKGEYVLSTIFLKSNIHIVLEKDAVILGSDNFFDYAPEEKIDYPLYQDSSHSYFHCSMFVGIGCDNISITGEGKIDMRSVWDETNVRKIVHRGPKCIALKECNNVEIRGIGIYNVTDLAVYFAGCKNVEISGLDLRVFIDGVSPDNCDGVKIYDCNIEAGDDSIVFKSSYNLNRYEDCQNIEVYNCKLKSRCTALKFGTESNNSFKNIYVHDCEIFETRITGIGIESVDGAVIENITIKNIKMWNVNAPLFVHLGKRLRGPKGTKIGEIKNILFDNITATGPYTPYKCVAWNYHSFIANDFYQDHHVFGVAESFDGTKYDENWQMTSNMCGLVGHPLENITLRNIYFELEGGVEDFNENVPEECEAYPEVYVYGKILPASGIYFRYIEGLTVENFKLKTLKADKRYSLVCKNVDRFKLL